MWFDYFAGPTATLLLVGANGYFVRAELACDKGRRTRIGHSSPKDDESSVHMQLFHLDITSLRTVRIPTLLRVLPMISSLKVDRRLHGADIGRRLHL
jgi:hypothetical protein